jgi:hypothetical protein
MIPGGCDREAMLASPARRLAAQNRTLREPGVGVVGTYLDHDLTTDAVSLDDASDHQVHVR